MVRPLLMTLLEICWSNFFDIQETTSRIWRAATDRIASIGSRKSSVCRLSAVVGDTVKTNGSSCLPANLTPLIRFCRFNKKEYAPIDIVLTEKKGFGLRAAGNIPKYIRSTDLVATTKKLLQGRLHL
jgi:hypothetical protein